MPVIKLQHVVSVSSEDKHFPAENLLKNDGFKKWKCLSGEKNATVTFQFEKALEINQIDIGNEGSAFIEVLVGKSSSNDDSYQVILMSSSFMNPAESRSSQNLNRVRIFGPDTLSKTAIGQKWDRVKVVCTQPFAKNTQYGLSFIKFYSTPADDKSENSKGSPTKQLTLGAFVVKTNVPDDGIKAGTLFEKSKQKPEEPVLTGAAAIRAASKVAENQTSKEIGSDQPSTSDLTTVQSSPKAKLKTVEKKTSDVASVSQKLKKKDSKESNMKRDAEEDTSSRSQSPPAKKSKTEAMSSSTASSRNSEKPFSKLMDKVVFVLSGFQNPFRGQLRDKAQEMGAVYKADWCSGCTHLICAFENTPKYNEVKGKGRIVKKEWIVDCHKQKKLLPWRQYRLGKAASPKASDSEEEASPVAKKIERQSEKEVVKAGASLSKTEKKEIENKKNEAKSQNGERKTFHQMSNEGDTDSLSDSDSTKQKPSKGKNLASKKVCVPSTSAKKDDEDIFNASTDEETTPCLPSTSAQRNNEDIYNASTDEEPMASEGNVSDDQLPELPDFFGRKSFFLYGNFSPSDRRLMIRYITAYNGLIIDYMDETIDYVVTDEPWDENFDQALSENSGLIFVKSSWILACDEAQKLVPHQKFVVSPQ